MKEFIFSFTVAISMVMTSCTKQPGNTPPNLPSGLVTTLVGPSFQITSGTGTAASFDTPEGVAVDALGNVYVADYDNNMIRKISPSGIVSTLAGSGTAGSVNGTGAAASFNLPSGVAVDAFGNVYVADAGNNLIREISTSASSYGVVTTLAGDPTGASGSANGNGTAASFFDPAGVAVDAAGNVYVADAGNNLIRKITTTGPSVGVVTTLAGAAGSAGSSGGATFNLPSGVAVDAAGNVYVADAGSGRILKISQSAGIPYGLVTTLAGSGTRGSANGTGTAASFDYPTGVALDLMGNVYVADAFNNLIREISPSGVVSTLAGGGTSNILNGTGTAASFFNPQGVAVDALGNVYVGDAGDELIRMITPSAVVTTLAGNGVAGFVNDTTTMASFNHPSGVAVDGGGNVYVADASNNLIRMISYPLGLVSTLAGSGMQGSANGTGTAASFYRPAGVAVDAAGNVYVSDDANNMIRKVSPSGVVTTLAGSGTGGSANGTGTAASFLLPWGIAVDNGGNVYVADAGNNMIRVISPSGVVTTLAGSGTGGSADGTGTAASFNYPTGVAIDAAGNVYVADQGNNMIRKISPSGVVTTLAGNGTRGSANGTGTAASASFNEPYGVAVDAAGNVYVADYGNNVIREISPSGGSTGGVTNLAGTGALGSANGNGLVASFNGPIGIAVDALGNVYVADAGNNLIRKIIQ